MCLFSWGIFLSLSAEQVKQNFIIINKTDWPNQFYFWKKKISLGWKLPLLPIPLVKCCTISFWDQWHFPAAEILQFFSFFWDRSCCASVFHAARLHGSCQMCCWGLPALKLSFTTVMHCVLMLKCRQINWYQWSVSWDWNPGVVFREQPLTEWMLWIVILRPPQNVMEYW